MPKPAPEMTKMIKMMGGNWTVTEKHDPNPMMPNGGTSKGTAVLTPGPGGMSLTEKYHSTGAMGSFNGLGTFWWDPKAQVYRGVWCDNMSPNGCDASGTTKWEGDKLVGTMEAEMNGQKMLTRFTYSDFKSDSFVMTMEIGSGCQQVAEGHDHYLHQGRRYGREEEDGVASRQESSPQIGRSAGSGTQVRVLF